MLKKFSAALIVASLLAAPAMAAGIEKTAPAPTAKPVASAAGKLHAKPALLNANARMVRHHHRHVRPHHRAHKKFGMNKTFKHAAFKSTVTPSRRG